MKTEHTTLLILAAYVFFFLPEACLAGLTPRTERAELERDLSRRRQREITPGAQKKMPEPDVSPRFRVRAVRITGNVVLSTEELVENLPPVYREFDIDPVTGKRKTDPVTGRPIITDTYDFGVLTELIARPWSSREVSARTIAAFTRYLLSVYREKGYRGIRVHVPDGSLDSDGEFVNGVLPIQVIEAKVANIDVERFTFEYQRPRIGFLKDSVIRKWSPIKEGEVIQKEQLDDFVNLLNLSPDRYVSAVVSRADEPNALDLTYDVYEANPWHPYVQVDDSGTRQRQWAPRIGLINTNLTGIDDRLSLQYQAPWEKGMEDEYAVFGLYDFPVATPRLRLGGYGGYSEFDITTEGISFLGNGSLFGSFINYNVAQIEGWFLDLTGSLSHQSSKVTPSLGIASDVDMDLWESGIQLHRRAEMDMSNTVFSLGRVDSVGGDSRNEFDDARTGADSDFVIHKVSAVHNQYLDSRKVHRVKTSFRMVNPDGRLVPAIMTVFGGLHTVRGYEEDEIVADGGILLSGQYEFDLVRYYRLGLKDSNGTMSANRGKPWLRKLAPLVFVDVGRARTEDPLPGEKRIQELASVGVGAIAEVQDDFTGALYCGWPLRSTAETEKGDWQLNVSLVYRF